MLTQVRSATHPAAVVCRAPQFRETGDQYLLFRDDGQPAWINDPAAATSFPSMAEATRVALHLPAPMRAFGLPRDPEITLRRDLH